MGIQADIRKKVLALPGRTSRPVRAIKPGLNDKTV